MAVTDGPREGTRLLSDISRWRTRQDENPCKNRCVKAALRLVLGLIILILLLIVSMAMYFLIGKHSRQSQSASCLLCAPGTHEQCVDTNRECLNCTWRDMRSGPESCSICNISNRGQSNRGQFRCIDCLQGQYQNHEGQAECIDCSVGQYQDNIGQTSCVDCSAGHYQDKTGQTGCIDCLAGQYQRSVGQVKCIDCPAGQYQDTPAQAKCIDCLAGQFQNKTGQTRCIDCAKGEYQDNKGQPTCMMCLPGQYQDSVGQDKCKMCPPENIPEQGVLPYALYVRRVHIVLEEVGNVQHVSRVLFLPPQAPRLAPNVRRDTTKTHLVASLVTNANPATIRMPKAKLNVLNAPQDSTRTVSVKMHARYVPQENIPKQGVLPYALYVRRVHIVLEEVGNVQHVSRVLFLPPQAPQLAPNVRRDTTKTHLVASLVTNANLATIRMPKAKLNVLNAPRAITKCLLDKVRVLLVQ